MGNNSDIYSLFSKLEFAILLRVKQNKFKLLNETPLWLKEILDDLDFDFDFDKNIDYSKFFPFLESFLETAYLFWENDLESSICSDLWLESDKHENVYYLRAFAMKMSGNDYLLIENINEKIIGNYTFIQKARNKSLKYESLKKVTSKLETNINYNKQVFPIVYSELEAVITNLNELKAKVKDKTLFDEFADEIERLSLLKNNIIWFDED
ncbi:MAG: hypothetical protein HN704_10560 [Bacteroidetes bacterium]|jgi:hypothetical protein|nr:hypothetical protein [Bacteroidota bacterium]MBT6685784.1 hypothetical protein [Bacteroidota bacterium]MBT7142354.1 hypothetical protein [Bacteroidota bacterium]MBT7492034.1 hypothetical protein [Bacteroidota bacterium]